jgi:hypothetical protein
MRRPGYAYRRHSGYGAYGAYDYDGYRYPRDWHYTPGYGWHYGPPY